MANGQDGDAALRAVADRLYAAPAASFTGERAAAVRQARDDGDRDLAARIGALAKPTTAAQLVNALARRAPVDLQQVLDLGEELRSAQEQGDRDALRELGVRRRRLLAEVAERAIDLADGRRPGEAVLEAVQQTLQAAMASEAAADAVRAGRLVRPLAADGLDPQDLQRAVAVPGGVPRRSDRAAASAPDDAEERRRREQAAEAARRHADELRRRAVEQRDAARAAATDADEREQESAALRDELEGLQHRLEVADRALQTARRTAEDAADEAAAAEQRAAAAADGVD